MKSNEVLTHPLAIIALLSVFLFLQCLSFALRTPFGAPPDEIAHLAYVEDAKTDALLLPDYASGTTSGGTKTNYLSHPPLYYSVLGAVSRLLDLDPREDYRILRVFNAALFSLGFCLFLIGLMNLGCSLAAIVAAASVCYAIPMFGYLGGSVNNDTLGYLSTALFFLGCSRLKLPRPVPLSVVTLIWAGLATSAVTKATTAAFVLYLASAFALLNFSTFKLTLNNRKFWLTGVIFMTPVLVYYAATFAQYGELFPIPGRLYAKNPPTSPHTLVAFFVIFCGALIERLAEIVSHIPQKPLSGPGRTILIAIVFTPIAAFLLSRARAVMTPNEDIKLFDAFFLAVFLFFATHFVNVYFGYLDHSRLAGLQPRYYFFALPVMLAAFSISIRSKANVERLSFVIIAGAMITFWDGIPDLLG